VTVVMVQHNLHAIKTMCHECIWLDHGSMVQKGDPEEVVAAYLRFQGVDDEDGAVEGDAPDAGMDIGGGFVDSTPM